MFIPLIGLDDSKSLTLINISSRVSNCGVISDEV